MEASELPMANWNLVFGRLGASLQPNERSLTGGAEAARREETRIPEWRLGKSFTEAASGLNDGLGISGTIN